MLYNYVASHDYNAKKIIFYHESLPQMQIPHTQPDSFQYPILGLILDRLKKQRRPDEMLVLHNMDTPFQIDADPQVVKKLHGLNKLCQ